MYNFSHCISGQEANNKSQSLAAILSGKRESSKKTMTERVKLLFKS